MPRLAPALTVQAIKSIPPGRKRQDGKVQGLLLHHTATGLRLWRMRFMNPATEKPTMVSLGAWPTVSLEEAREAALKLLQALASDDNPFVAVGRRPRNLPDRKFLPVGMPTVGELWDYYETLYSSMVSRGEKKASTLQLMTWRIQKYILPEWGETRVDLITPSLSTELLMSIANGSHPATSRGGGISTAHKLHNHLNKIWESGSIKWNGKFPKDIHDYKPGDFLGTIKTEHHPYMSDPLEIGSLLKRIDSIEDQRLRIALNLYEHIPLRATELITIKFSDIDFEKKIIVIPSDRMKRAGGKDHEHIIPMSSQVEKYIRELESIKESEYVFPSRSTNKKAISDRTIANALKELKPFATVKIEGKTELKEVTLHGFRSQFKSHCIEKLNMKSNYDERLLEMCMGHVAKTPNGGAYDRWEAIEDRRAIFQKYSNYLEKLREAK